MAGMLRLRRLSIYHCRLETIEAVGKVRADGTPLLKATQLGDGVADLQTA
jgi:hypothetical protein